MERVVVTVLLLLTIHIQSVHCQVQNCTGRYLTPSICIPKSYVKEIAPDMPVKVMGEYRKIEIISLNLRKQQMTVEIWAVLAWAEPR